MCKGDQIVIDTQPDTLTHACLVVVDVAGDYRVGRLLTEDNGGPFISQRFMQMDNTVEPIFALVGKVTEVKKQLELCEPAPRKRAVRKPRKKREGSPSATNT